MYLKVKLQQDTPRQFKYKLKCHKTEEITYLEANKQQIRYRLSYLEVSNLEQGTIDVLKAKPDHEK